MKRCVQCSEMLPGDANFCPVCGGKAEAITAAPAATANAAVAPTMPDMSALGGRAAPAPTKSVPPPPPTTASGVVGTSTPPATSGGGKNPAFRETLWFKKGEVDEFLAKARSSSNAAGPAAGGPGAPEAPAEDIRPLEDRYQDDGSLSSADRAKFSLRTGATVYQAQSPLKAKPVAIPGQRMSDQELIAEFNVVKGKGRWIAIGIGALLLIVIVSMFSGKKSAPEQPAEAPAPAAEPH